MAFKITTKEIFPHLIHFHFDTQYEITSSMMRMQEFYESPNKSIRGKYFEVEDYMDAYANTMGNFTYTVDWTGFNVPGNIVTKFFKVFDGNLLAKEVRLKNVLIEAKETAGINDNKFYLIASYDDKKEGKGVLEHEIAHGLYYLNTEYKSKMLKVITSMPDKTRELLHEGLIGKRYTDHVIFDEIQAYFATSEMMQLCEDFDTKEIPWKSVFRAKEIFQDYYSKIKND